MCELEFSSQPGGLVLAAVMVVQNLKRHRVIRLGGCVRPVHRGVSAPAQRRVDDVALELFAEPNHGSSLGPAAPFTFLTA